MKNKTSIFLLCLLIVSLASSGISYGQSEEASATGFDSTRNFLGQSNVETYAGQILYVLPQPEIFRDHGYEGFKEYVDYKKFIGHTGDVDVAWKHYGRAAKSKPCNTLYEDLEGKCFIVDSVEVVRDMFYRKLYFFALTNRDDTDDKCYFIYNKYYDFAFPFLVVSHRNYLVKKHVGTAYVLSNDGKYGVWKGKDIVVSDEGDVQIGLVSSTGKIYRKEQEFSFSSVGQNIFERSQWDEFVGQYGREYMICVLNRNVKVGMPELLLAYSLGFPRKINEDPYGLQQYVYEYMYVYVKNGKVSSWQKF